MRDTPSVLVVGGGIVGLTAARSLARSGHSVTLLERGTVGAEASRAAAGMLIPLAESDPGPFRALALASFAAYEGWVRAIEAEDGAEVGFVRSGQIVYATDTARLRHLEEVHRSLPPDSDARLLDRDGVLGLEPSLRPDVLGGLHFPSDAHVDNRRLVPALARAATRAGATIHEGVEVVALEERGDGTAVVLADGSRRRADRVLVASGAWTSQLRGIHPQVSVRPVRGQMLALRSGPRSVPSAMVDGGDVYMIPRDGRVLVGGTVEERGFDRLVDPSVVDRQRTRAAEAVPSLADAPVDEVWVGFRPAAPDRMPILSWDPERPRVFYATAHYRNGILLAPITDQIIQWSFQGRTHPLAEAFAIGRSL